MKKIELVLVNLFDFGSENKGNLLMQNVATIEIEKSVMEEERRSSVLKEQGNFYGDNLSLRSENFVDLSRNGGLVGGGGVVEGIF